MKKVIAYIHTHWDREWYRVFEDFRLRLIEVFDEVLDSLEKGDLPCFYFDGQIAALEDYLEIKNEKLPLVKFLIKQKKLRTGPFYCSSDSFLVSGESLYRNLKIGTDKAKELGENDFIAYIADSFGHSKDLPLLLNLFRLSKVCLWRGIGDLNADLDWHGIKVTNLIQGYYQDFLHSNLPVEQKAQNLKKYLDKISEKSTEIILLPIGGDHLAIPKNINETIKELNNIYNDYKICLASPFDYFYRIYKSEKISGEFLDNSKTFLLKGVYSSRPCIKRANALSQWQLSRIAEPLNALALKYYASKNKQNEINYAYKELIKNHAHDSIYGCCTDEVAEDILSRYRTVNAVSNGIIKRIIRDLETKSGDLTVINLSNYKYNGIITIETDKKLPDYLNAVKVSSRTGFTDEKLYNINEVPVTEDITAINKYIIDVKNLEPFSLTKITPDKICSENFLNATKNSIENSNIKIEITENKINVTDKIQNKIYEDFITLTDMADIGDSYNFGALLHDKPLIAEIKSYRIKETNNIKAVLNVIYEISIPLTSNEKGRNPKKDKCKINFDFILYNQSKMAQIQADWINKSENHILRIGFNLKKQITSTISEDLFSTVERKFNPKYDIYKKIPAKKGIELKTNTAPMQRFVNAQNLTLITKGINEYEVNKNTLYLTLLRATGIISNPKNPCRGTSAGPPIETPDMQCLSKNEANFAFAFTNNTNTMFELTEEFYYPCVSFFSDKNNKILFNPKGRVYGMNIENDCLYSRIYNERLCMVQNKLKTEA